MRGSRSKNPLDLIGTAPGSVSSLSTRSRGAEGQGNRGERRPLARGARHEPPLPQEKMSPTRGEACTENPLAPLLSRQIPILRSLSRRIFC